MWYDNNCRDRILEWRRWRQRLDSMPWQECVCEVAKVWHLAPRVNHYLLPDLSADWPNPWELINENYYCDLAIALGMFYTLILTNHPENVDVKLQIYQGDSGFDHLCVVDGGKYYLNWSSGEIVNTPTLTNTKLVYSYSKEDLLSKLR